MNIVEKSAGLSSLMTRFFLGFTFNRLHVQLLETEKRSRMGVSIE